MEAFTHCHLHVQLHANLTSRHNTEGAPSILATEHVSHCSIACCKGIPVYLSAAPLASWQQRLAEAVLGLVWAAQAGAEPAGGGPCIASWGPGDALVPAPEPELAFVPLAAPCCTPQTKKFVFEQNLTHRCFTSFSSQNFLFILWQNLIIQVSQQASVYNKLVQLFATVCSVSGGSSGLL